MWIILWFRFNYECPDMFNEADFVISILNSENEKVKENVIEMCKLTSTDQQTKLNYDLFNDQVNRIKFYKKNKFLI